MVPELLKTLETHIQAAETTLHDLGKSTGRSLRLGLRPTDGTLLVLDAEGADPLFEIPTDCGVWWLTPPRPAPPRARG